jgi:hypothetical protein
MAGSAVRYVTFKEGHCWAEDSNVDARMNDLGLFGALTD